MNTFKIAVFTPTYNRAKLLPQLFESLQKQTCLDFYWLIIDDGSADDTRDVVESFQNTAKFEIKYVYKENGGKHTAINLMLDIINTELVLVIDSDDFISENAIEIILQDYADLNDENVCELLYLRGHNNGAIIGEPFSSDCGVIDPMEIINGNKGDKCNVLVTKVFCRHRFPTYPNENFMGETVLWHPIYRESRKIFVRNIVIYYCEYREDGLSMAGRQMRIKQPLGGMEHANSYLFKEVSWKRRIKYAMLYVCYGQFAGQSLSQIYRGLKEKKLFIICIPLGCMLHLYWKLRFGKKGDS